MLNFRIVCMGSLKEKYLKDAAAEYQKRLGGFCTPSIVELKEYKLSENPSQAEIQNALDEEADRILQSCLPRSYKIALCIEGKQLSSEKLAEKLGIEAYGINADYHTYRGQIMRDVREVLARCKDFANMIFKPEPTYLGEKISVSGDGDITNDKQ